MCWNAEISLNTFIFGIISMIILLLLNNIDYVIILFTFTISLIQLMEYYAWNNINDKKIIYKLSIIGFFILFSQILLFNYRFLNTKDRNIGLIIIIIFSIYLFIYNYNNDKFKMVKGENNHFVWHWVDFPLPLFIIVIFFYIYPAISFNYILFILVLIPLSISLYYYYKYKTFGSMWCYIGNIYWILLIIISVFKEKIYG